MSQPASSPSTRPVIGYINIGVLDFPRAVAFYRDVVGLPLKFSDEKFQYAGFDAGGVSFAVAGGHEVKAAREGKPENHTGIGICVPDVDAAYAGLLTAGATDRMSPRPSPEPGVRMAYVADPEGNLVELLDRTVAGAAR